LVVLGNLLVWTTVAGCGPDNGNPDAGDASPDQTTDVGMDTTNDVGNDVVGNDASDAGEAGYDAAAVINFQQAYAAALCKAYGTYCFQAELDASLPSANLAFCEATVTGSGGGGPENVIGDLSTNGVIDSGTVFVDETAATSCLAGVMTMTLPNIPGSEYATIAQNCIGALSGSQASGQPCNATIECGDGFCAAGGDAGGKVCVPLSGLNGACGSFSGSGNDQCMYRGWTGSPQLRCDNVEPDGGAPSNKCTAKLTQGSACYWEWDCQSDTCDNNDTCNTNSTAWTLIVLGGGTCPLYFGADAGLN